ncbi:MAG: hypothetical protein IVW52_05570 [Acidimicrobiales bacterium]|nr:hypothetical protein [Acidimicrobiales bacterium]
MATVLVAGFFFGVDVSTDALLGPDSPAGVRTARASPVESDADARGEQGAMGEVCQNCLAIRS